MTNIFLFCLHDINTKSLDAQFLVIQCFKFSFFLILFCNHWYPLSNKILTFYKALLSELSMAAKSVCNKILLLFSEHFVDIALLLLAWVCFNLSKSEVKILMLLDWWLKGDRCDISVELMYISKFRSNQVG